MNPVNGAWLGSLPGWARGARPFCCAAHAGELELLLKSGDDWPILNDHALALVPWIVVTCVGPLVLGSCGRCWCAASPLSRPPPCGSGGAGRWR